MKTIILSISILLTGLLMTAQNPAEEKQIPDEAEGVSITVNVPVKSSEGTVIFGLYNEETFMTAAPIQGMESEIDNQKASVTFENVEPGTYAVILFHDKNGNKQMDFDPQGMPLEMYGTSNNDMNAGPPQWNLAKFQVEEESLTLEIIM